MKHVNIDIETRSSVDLIKCGMYKYAQSEDFTVLLIGFSVDDGPVTVLDMTTGVEPVGYSEFLEILTSGDYIKHAYNAAFEWYCLSMFTGIALSPSQWRDTMLQAQYCAFPGSLEAHKKGYPRLDKSLR